MAITITGIDEVINGLEKALGVEKMTNNIGQACAIVERAAKENAPKGSGELRRSITSKVESSGTQIQGTVYTPLEYAPYVEYGTGLFAKDGNGRQEVPWRYFNEETQEWVSTSGQHPQPYLVPALKDNRDKIIDKLREGLKQ